MYHVYKNGYSTLPNLKKLQKNEVFEKNRTESAFIQKEKKLALNSQRCFLEQNNPEEFYEICKNFITENYPIELTGNSYREVAEEIDEDLLIHRIDNEKDYVSSIHACFPSSWLPEEKIGKSFEEVHAPVPMNLKNSKKLVEAIVFGGMFERFVWSIIYEKKYNFHPSFNCKKFDPENPEFYIKVERQVTVGFPKEKFCLFILRQYLIENKEIDKNSLFLAIENMNDIQKSYKSLNQNFINFIDN